MKSSITNTFNFSTKLVVACGIATGLGLAAQPAVATPVTVNHFGDAGWYSSDTRDASGTNLYGQNDTHPALNTGNGGAVAGDDAKIEQQISFVHGPAGSLNSKGAVKLYATEDNSGKANLSILNTTTNGFGAGSALVNSNFFVNYRYYDEPAPTSRTLGISISLTDGTNYYTFSYVNPNNTANVWQTVNANENSQNWRLFGSGAPGSSENQTLVNWANDPRYGDLLTSDYTIYEVGFNLGSYQRQNNTYVDWFQSNLTNGSNLVDFQAVPEPGALAMFGLGLIGLGFLGKKARSDRKHSN